MTAALVAAGSGCASIGGGAPGSSQGPSAAHPAGASQTAGPGSGRAEPDRPLSLVIVGCNPCDYLRRLSRNAILFLDDTTQRYRGSSAWNRRARTTVRAPISWSRNVRTARRSWPGGTEWVVADARGRSHHLGCGLACRSLLALSHVSLCGCEVESQRFSVTGQGGPPVGVIAAAPPAAGPRRWRARGYYRTTSQAAVKVPPSGCF
jgi:hypothetical protein